eukprot:GHVQ01015996.1.p2 GENE.GHVQ01015996.1~~GHVQ01015996.1.p2  ORF type:complete len:285 (-),score=48.07 GHVQ01015996.1:1396-2250(-)
MDIEENMPQSVHDAGDESSEGDDEADDDTPLQTAEHAEQVGAGSEEEEDRYGNPYERDDVEFPASPPPSPCDPAGIYRDAVPEISQSEENGEDREQYALKRGPTLKGFKEKFKLCLKDDDQTVTQLANWIEYGIAPDGTRAYYTPTREKRVLSEFKILPSYIWEYWTGSAAEYQGTTTEYPVEYRYDHSPYLLHIGPANLCSMNSQICFKDGTKMPADDPLRGSSLTKQTGDSKTTQMLKHLKDDVWDHPMVQAVNRQWKRCVAARNRFNEWKAAQISAYSKDL